MKRLLTATLIAAVTAISVTGAQAGSLNGKSCKSWVSGTGASYAKYNIKLQAQMNWHKKAKALYGSAYADFSKAKYKAFSCNTEKVQGKWYCTVRAKPCKSFGFKKS